MNLITNDYSVNFVSIDTKKALKTDLDFLEDHFKTAGQMEFRLLPNQKYDHRTFSEAYWRKFIHHFREQIDFIASYYVDSRTCDQHAHVLLKLKNEYWVYIHVYGEYSGLEYWGANELTCYCNKDLNYLIKYGISNKDYDKLGISSK